MISIQRHQITTEAMTVRATMESLANSIVSREEDLDPIDVARFDSVDAAIAALRKKSVGMADIRPANVGYCGQYEMLTVVEADDDETFAIVECLVPDTLRVYGDGEYRLEGKIWMRDE